MDERVCSASTYLTLCKCLKKVIPAIKFRHLYIGVTYFTESMGITAGTLSNCMLLSKDMGLIKILEGDGSGIKYFYNINLVYYFFYNATIKSRGSELIKRVRYAYQAALSFDLGNRF